MFPKLLLVLAVAVAGLPHAIAAQDPKTPLAESYLIAGRLPEGETFLIQHLAKSPNDQQARFGLGALQFFRAVEHLGQSLYKFGPRENFGAGIPILRLPVPSNRDPQPVTYEDLRGVFQQLIDDLNRADATLAKVTSDDVRLPLRIMQFHLDFNGDGTAQNNESVLPIFRQYLGGARARDNEDGDPLKDLVIHFDQADAVWLRGYCCLLRAMCETILAFDHTEFWEVSAHRLFDNPKMKHDFLKEETADQDFTRQIMDAIAAIHNLRFKLVEPQRLERAHQHMLQTIAHSREMWRLIQAEMDDENEWIPSPRQQAVASSIPITQEMNETWEVFLKEAELILTGEKLIPFWRGNNPKRGVNVKRFFLEPQDIDVVLIVTGTGVVPYLEEGELTTEATWRRFNRVFRGDFIGFAIWFN